MRNELMEAVKTAMKAGDKDRLTTLRMMHSAIKDLDIANRGHGKEPGTDAEILQLMAKLVKQREESAKAFEDGKRPELAAKERGEIEVIRDFMPKQLDEEAMKSAVATAIAKTGAGGIKDMGKVMAALREDHAGQMDFGKAGALVKAALQ